MSIFIGDNSKITRSTIVSGEANAPGCPWCGQTIRTSGEIRDKEIHIIAKPGDKVFINGKKVDGRGWNE